MINISIYIGFLFFLLYLSIKDIVKNSFSIIDLSILNIFTFFICGINIFYLSIIFLFISLELIYKKNIKNFFNFGLPDLYLLILLFIITINSLFISLSISIIYFFIHITINYTLLIFSFLIFITLKKKSSKEKYKTPFFPFIFPIFFINILYFLLNIK